jgi:hypothetical protein
MPKLSFYQLTKIFGAGLLGYALFIGVLSLGTALFFPNVIKTKIDMSIHEFLKSVLVYFGLLGLFATILLLLCAWCVLRVTRRPREYD